MRHSYSILPLGFGVICFWVCLFAQGPDTLWTRKYDYQLIDWANKVLETTDHGYLLVGQTCTYGNNAYLIIKTDRSGYPLWSKIYEWIIGSFWEEAWGAVETPDSGYIIVGASEYIPMMMKLDSNGDSVWTKPLPFSALDIQKTLDGNYIITGGAGAYLWLAKISETGDTIWTKKYGGNGINTGYQVRACSDGGYIIGGVLYSGGNPRNLIKTNANGDTLWTKALGSNIYTAVRPTINGGYIATAYYNDDAHIFETDANGNIRWSVTYGGSETDVAYSVDETYDGCYVAFGETGSFGAGGYDAFIIKVNTDGDTVWTKTYGDAGHDEGWYGICTSDSGYIITGCYSPDGLNGDVFLIKTVPDITGIAEGQNLFREKSLLSLSSNPVVNGEIDFTYNLPRNKEIRISLYNVLGQEAKLLFNGLGTAGSHRIRERLDIPAGIYFLKLTAGTDCVIKKLVVVK
uniref:T9SS type A sorting domain-containing protein n=1 Tax=candidate division WOR-3 bacterium TaxID=2052148 RepID=A0A7C4XE46_UNCW3